MRHKKIYGLLFFLLSPALVFAGGSTYSRFGKGDILLFGGSRAYAMGGTGISSLGEDFINQLNPAGLSKITNPLLTGSFETEHYSSESLTGSGTFNTFNFQSFVVAIPISVDNGIVLSLEATPYSKVRYATSRTDSVLTADGGTMMNSFYGSGGIMSLGLGISYSVTEHLHLGLKFQNYYGNCDQFLVPVYSDSTLTSKNYEASSYYNGIGATFGAIWENIGTSIGVHALDNISVGFVFSTPVSLSTDSTIYYPSIDTSTTHSGISMLPYSIGLGLTYIPNEQYRFAADFIYQNWKNSKYFDRTDPNIRDAYRFGVGFEFLPKRETAATWGRTAYRLGGYYYSTYYYINGTGIDEIGVTGGIGVPLSFTGKLDVGFQYAMRGTTSASLQKDKIFRMNISVSVSELWFFKFEDPD
jgi:hypothetical protein